MHTAAVGAYYTGKIPAASLTEPAWIPENPTLDSRYVSTDGASGTLVSREYGSV